MSAQPLSRITPEQYLEIERAAEYKSEYFEGQMVAMAGASPAHAYIAMNFGAELRQALKQKPCRVAGSDLRIRVSQEGLYTYPDVVVVCGQPRYADDQGETLLNPTVLIEVLSKSTEAYDRGFKFAQYRRIESLREYVLVAQTEVRVEVFELQADGAWRIRESAGLDASCRLNSIDCTISLAEIYGKIEFAASTAPL
jgi:Uma2 family endonuclease